MNKIRCRFIHFIQEKMEKLLTTTEFAEAIGASESSVRRWTNSGAIHTARTAGGHRRIPLPEAIRFVRESGSAIVRPELLGMPILPAAAGKLLGSQALEENLYEALRSGNAISANGCVAGLFLNGLSVAAICDGPMHGAMKRIGELWPNDPRAILVEHRATTMSLHALGMLRQMIGQPAEHAPIALGGAPQGDPYILPSMMAGTVLAEAGFHEMNFGPDTPLEVLAVAAREHKARIAWLAVKATVEGTKARDKVNALAEQLAASGTLFVLGGSAVTSLGLRLSKNLHIMQNMTELAAFARGAAGLSNVVAPGVLGLDPSP